MGRARARVPPPPLCAPLAAARLHSQTNGYALYWGVTSSAGSTGESRMPRYLASCVPAAHASRWRWWNGSAGTPRPPPVAGHQEALEVPVPRPPPRVGHQAAARWLWRTAARTVSRTPATVGRPACAMRACFGIEVGRASSDGPVRSAQLTVNFPMWDAGTTGSQVAAAYSNLRRTYPLATMRRGCSCSP